MQCCLDVLDVVAVGLVVDEYPEMLGILSRSPNNTAIMERLRLDDKSGPCHEAFLTGAAVECNAVAEIKDRWPTFVPMIHGRGIASVLALPLRYRQETVGALALFCDARGLHDPEQQLVARGLADLATMAIVNRRQLLTRSPGTTWRETIELDRPAAVSLA
jgi:GAF domain-containing protein